MLPTYTNVKLHDDAARTEPVVLEFRLNLIRGQLQEQREEMEKVLAGLRIEAEELNALAGSELRIDVFQCFLERKRKQ